MNVHSPLRAQLRRCAVYTRKSSEEGLDQAFNSLHAQREACEAYVKSQVGEGWSLNETSYDDGGFSGGNMERPALKQLLSDISRGQVDIVVVYKVDRLTRSLSDFARIVDTFDRAGASFVSVTQAFNTTTSMGRLTLNVLLSFAQFEREVTGERIRDKIAASKAKGMWMGGTVPLGYDSKERQLVVNEAEAETVRMIFQRYLKLGSVHQLRDELQAKGVFSKPRKDQTQVPLNRGALFYILKNRHYLGEIVHKELVYPGKHQAILDRKLFDSVQRRLAANVAKHHQRPIRSAQAPLKGLIFDAGGQPMSPSFGYGSKGKLYRYYVATELQKGQASKTHSDAPRRLSADAVEAVLLDHLARFSDRPSLTWERGLELLRRVEVRGEDTQLLVDSDALFGLDHPDLAIEDLRARLLPGERVVRERGAPHLLRFALPGRLQLRGGRTWRSHGEQCARRSADPALVALLRRAHAKLEEVNASVISPRRSGPEPNLHHDRHARRLWRIGLLAPDIQAAILEGRQPPTLTAQRLREIDLPLAFDAQRQVLGF